MGWTKIYIYVNRDNRRQESFFKNRDNRDQESFVVSDLVETENLSKFLRIQSESTNRGKIVFKNRGQESSLRALSGF